MINLNNMTTETRNENTMDLDMMSYLEIITLMNREDAEVPKAIEKVLPKIAQAIEWVVESLNKGGRLFYVGAGTSGRLGVLDAAECPPTFGVQDDLIIGVIAGGSTAFLKAVEGAEDSITLGEEDLKERNLNKKDIVIGIAASGRTPYVIGALEYAKKIGCKTAAISCNKDSEIGKKADLKIEVVVGPEVLTGSTRLKAGTAQKLILNMISTASLVGIGKAYQNLMVDVIQTNKKLETRAQNIVMSATNVDKKTAEKKLQEAGGSAKIAITMILMDCDAKSAKEKLIRSKGHIRKAL